MKTSSSSNQDGGLAIDNDPDSRWSTGTRQVLGQFFLIDLGTITNFDRIVLSTSSDQPFDFPRLYEVTVSDDGVNFSNPRAAGTGSATTNIEIGDTTARYVRIEQQGSDNRRYWSIYDLELFNQ